MLFIRLPEALPPSSPLHSPTMIGTFTAVFQFPGSLQHLHGAAFFKRFAVSVVIIIISSEVETAAALHLLPLNIFGGASSGGFGFFADEFCWGCSRGGMKIPALKTYDPNARHYTTVPTFPTQAQ